MDQHIESLTSEYYFLFRHACEATLASGIPFLPLSGNATRRLFEGFLKFKFPNGSKLQNSIESQIVAKALHQASHRQELNIHTLQDLSTIQDEIRATLVFMAIADPHHFADMVEATKCPPFLDHHATAVYQIQPANAGKQSAIEWNKKLAQTAAG